MAIGFFKGGRDEDALLADINTTPLVDVMLVLLIIFLITIPAVHTSVAVSLPRQANQVRETRPENIVVSVDATGATYWGDQRLPDARALQERLQAALRTCSRSPRCMSEATRGPTSKRWVAWCTPASTAGITRIGFITEPPAAGAR
jgi:biopolymer transport protein ExbD